ncbi:hypothetical protein V5799_008564 [Amblyomma americanum]|uniref:Secreted protein n=1 Tax=Amblyomma americanum TaxID=6943 RepID=A0AAQ4FEK0_AMBAM
MSAFRLILLFFVLAAYEEKEIARISDCYFSHLPSDFSNQVRESVTSLFNGMSIVQTILLFCEINNDDGYSMINAWIKELPVNLMLSVTS